MAGYILAVILIVAAGSMVLIYLDYKKNWAKNEISEEDVVVEDDKSYINEKFKKHPVLYNNIYLFLYNLMITPLFGVLSLGLIYLLTIIPRSYWRLLPMFYLIYYIIVFFTFCLFGKHLRLIKMDSHITNFLSISLWIIAPILFISLRFPFIKPRGIVLYFAIAVLGLWFGISKRKTAGENEEDSDIKV